MRPPTDGTIVKVGVTEVRTVLADDVVMGTLDDDTELEDGVTRVVELDRTINGI